MAHSYGPEWLRHRQTGLAAGFVQATVSTQKGKSVAKLAWVIASAPQRKGYAPARHVHSDNRASMASGGRD
jgi:hypothetical protein